MKTQNLQNFGMVQPGANVRLSPFSAFSTQTGSGTLNYFSGALSSSQNFVFPNSDDQIIEINEISVEGYSTINSLDGSITIQRNDKTLFKIPLWELADKGFGLSTAAGDLKSKIVSPKKLMNPILVNGSDNIKIKTYCSSSLTITVYLRGRKFSKLNSFNYDERAGKMLGRADYTLFHNKTITASASNLIFSGETNENTFSKQFPLSKSEAFNLCAIEIGCNANAIASQADMATAEAEILNTANELKILINNVEVFKSSDHLLCSYAMKLVTTGYAGSFKYSNYILPAPIVIPANSSVQVYFTSGARSKASANLLFMLKGELISEVN